MASKRNAALDAMIEETTVDAYGAAWIDAYRHWAGGWAR